MKKLVLSCTIFLCFTCVERLEAEHWNQFRGPNGSGIATKSFNPPIKINNENIAWKTKIPEGLSSPVIFGKRIFLTSIRQDKLLTLCFDTQSGKILWERVAPQAPIEKVHATSSPAASTPLVDSEQIYVYFGSYGLLCYDHNGMQKWQIPIPTPKSRYGMSTSPISYKKTLILVIDNDENLPGSRLSKSKIIAFNKDDGTAKWTISRPHHRSGWSTPTIWNNGKNDELIVLGNERVRSYDPSTGTEKWFVGGFSRETIAVPVVGNGHVYISSAQLGGGADKQIDPDPFWKALSKFDTNDDEKVSRTEMIGDFTYPLRPELPLGHPGFGIPLPKEPNRRKERIDGILRWIDTNRDNAWTRDEFVNHMKFKRGRPLLLAIRSGGTGNVEESHVSWELNRSIPEIPSPVFYQNKIYLVRNGGIFAAIDAESGKQFYRERVSGSGQYSASPIVANKHLYLVSERGQVSVIEPGKTFSQIHKYDIGEPVFVTPAVDASSIYFRSDTHLWAFRKQ